MMSSFLEGLSYTTDTVRICFWALEEPAVASKDIVHAVLRCSVELWN